MTTTVCDFINRVVASDSRWSTKLDDYGFYNHIAFVDDTGFGKLSIRGNHVLCLAGDGKLIEQWKQWWKAPVLYREHPPVVSDAGAVVIYAINRATNQLEFGLQLSCAHLDPDTRHIQAVFSGSGETAALSNWQSAKCAKTAVEQAKLRDVFTGGTVRFVNLSTDEMDIEDELDSLDAVLNQLQERGYVMRQDDPMKTMIPVKEFDAKTISALASNGSLQLSAPCGNEAVVWDEAAKHRLGAFIDRVIESESRS
ncbi:hypothetical protein ABDZ38_00475 [Aeromonas caviae]|uniref:hypothetical protein n=1 Tax=Aeromonas TaxID=642 RepID=UPI0005D91B5E|nr:MULTISPECIES: hypothetical protein [Aeromonas]AKA17312.1 hypothetical protein VU14_10745 [Aeromonas hydrophila]